MKRLLLMVLAALILFGGVGGVEGAVQDGEFSVATFTPQGIVKGKPAVTVVFSQPAAAKESVGRPVAADKLPLTFSPRLRGEGKWTDEKTFVFTPSSALPQATLFRCTVSDALRDLQGRRLSGRQTFEFSTEALKLLSVRQSDFSNDRATLDLNFNLPVTPQRLRGFLTILNEQKGTVEYTVFGNAPASMVQVAFYPSDASKFTAVVAPGLTSDAGPLGTTTTGQIPVTVTRQIEITSLFAQSRSADQGVIRVSTSVGADLASVRQYVELSPAGSFTVEPEYNGFSIVGDFAPRQRVTVTIKKGLPSSYGTALARDFTQAVIFPDMEPGVTFPTGGSVLSPAGDLRIPIETINTDEISLNLWRVYENNIPVAMSGYSVPRELARLVASKKAYPQGKLNEAARRAIDLREFAGDAKGVFLLTANLGDGEYWSEVEQLVAVTDLGVVARVFPDGITVWVNSILGMKPVPGATVRVYSKSNQVLISGETDESGLWAWRGTSDWDSQLTPWLVTVEKRNDLSFLRLENDLLADNSFDTGGRAWKKGYDAMLFAPRGVFRPGETVDLSAIVRNEKWMPPEAFPLLFVVRSSMGREVARGTAMLTAEGMGSFALPLAAAAPTGKYSATVELPGGEVLGRTEFFVEDFVAPRLEVKATSDRAALAPGEELTVNLSSLYLFGAPAAGLPFEGEIMARAIPFQHEKWRAFVFGDSTKTFETVSEPLDGGTLDGDGKGTLSYEPPEGWAPPSAVRLTVLTRVMEESGRWVNASLNIPFNPYPVYLGIQSPEGERNTGKETAVRVAAVTPEGQPSDLERVTASLFMVQRHYNLVRTGNQSRYQEQKEFVPQTEEAVNLKEGVGTFSFTPKSQGEYLLRFTDEASGSTASTTMFVWAPYGAQESSGSSLPDRVTIALDKEKYAPGDKAAVTLRSPFPGNLLITVETDRELFRSVVTLDKGSATVEIPVTQEMVPNGYVTAWVVRPVVAGEPWGSHRAIGIAPIFVEQGQKRLSVALSAPERTQPGEPLTVQGTITDGSGAPRAGEVVLFFVDEGVLALTGFATPDPWEFFMGRRARSASGYDLYDNLLPLEGRDTPLLKAGGGAAAMEAALRMGMSPMAARSFVILSIVSGRFTADDKGQFSATLSIPEFTGKGRLMAVAASKDLFGKGEAQVTIARDVTAELSLPRAVSPADAFEAPLKLFSSSDEERQVTVTIAADGALGLSGEKTFSATLPKRGDNALFQVPFTAAGEAGRGAVTVTTEWNGGRSVQTLDLPVRPAYPRISRSGSGTAKANAPATVTIPREWFPGTEEGRLVLSGLPSLQLLGAVSFLRQYPYGCLEQTVSGAWPLLVLPDILADVDPELVNEDSRSAALATRIRQISAMQLYDGGFASWPGNATAYPWGSVYAAHLLVEAKKSGAALSDDLVNNALGYLRRLLPLAPEGDGEAALSENLTVKAYASYVLALAGDAPLGWMAYIKENDAHLRSSGAIFLAGAYALAENSPEPLKALGTGAPGLQGGETTFETASRTNALKLLMWTAVDPLSSAAAQLAQGLIGEASANRWNTTQDNAMGVLALGRWLVKTRDARKPFTGRLTDGAGKDVASFTDEKAASVELRNLPAGDLTLTIEGEGSAYYAWTSSGVPLKAPAPSNNGLTVKRAWQDTKGKALTPGTPIAHGTRVEVTLTVRPAAPMRNIVVVDMLPGGMEIENPRLTGGGDDEPSGGIRSEMRDDRLILFIDFADGPVTYKYLLRAVSRGTFVLPPLAGEGMYAPDIASVTATGKIEIR